MTGARGDCAVLDVQGLSFSIGDRALLVAVDLQVGAGESVAITGRSGSGKTTLLSLLLGLAKPSAGSIRVGGEDVTGASQKSLARLRRQRIGMVFQTGELLPELTPLENVVIASLLGGATSDDARSRATELLERFGVPDGARTANLSGGERQRVALARALVNRPALLLADEPTGSLDTVTRDSVAKVMFSLPAQEACALVLVTHDRALAAGAGRRLELVDGSLSAAPNESLSC